MMIAGEAVSASTTARFPTFNPATGECWATIPQASASDVDAAVSAARSSFDGGWGQVSGYERARLLHRLADLIDAEAEDLARLETTDNGKVIRETRNQIRFAARNFRFFAGYADKLYGRTIPLDRADMFDYTVRRPHGVVALITAWNSPFSLLANKVPPALATGNAVVLKPSEHASATTCEFGRLARAAGFPDGVVNVVTGDGVVGDLLTKHKDIDKISFTGGTATGRRVAGNAALRTVPVTLELGGKSPNLIFDDADLPLAIAGAVSGIFAAAGQTCIAGSRLLVQDQVYEQVVTEVAARAGRIRLGDPLEDETEMGPVANQPQFDRILGLIDEARLRGATPVAGGSRAVESSCSKGLYIEPTVFADVAPEMAIAREEIFGPVLSIIPFSTEEEAVQLANATEYGLASGIWTRDIGRALRVVERMQTGLVWVNTYRASAAQAPVGGTKQSGYGRERGEEVLAEYTYVKNVMIDFSAGAQDPFTIKT